MKHGEYRYLGMASETDQGVVVYEATLGETWCEHCKAWIRTDGVLGGLRFMAQHRDGDCRSAMPANH